MVMWYKAVEELSIDVAVDTYDSKINHNTEINHFLLHLETDGGSPKTSSFAASSAEIF